MSIFNFHETETSDPSSPTNDVPVKGRQAESRLGQGSIAAELRECLGRVSPVPMASEECQSPTPTINLTFVREFQRLLTGQSQEISEDHDLPWVSAQDQSR